ncbi:unnamed protein product [Sphagnum jensenii]|uniref:Sirohydrochlorin ferrochelatase n=1 Tax=Sphagnum jensenii TaxID=128206 RepID=A0ABP0VMW7_9BRYO
MASCLRSGGTFSVSLSSCCSSVKAQKARQNARVLSCPVVQKNGARISCGLEERYRRCGWGAQGRADRVQCGCGARVLKATLFPGFRNGKGVVVCGINGKSLEAQDLVQAGDAVVIVDHGSRRPESNVMLHEFVELYKQRTGHPIVEPAHMELAEPSIGTAFKCCVEQGATRVIICPYFLFPGRHWDKDIPALAAQAAEQHTGVPYVVTAPIGLHELMVRVVEDRMQYCMSHVAGKVAECSMCAGTGRCQQLTSNPRPTMSTNSSNN